MVPGPAARLHVFEFLESEMTSSSKSHRVRCLDTIRTVHTKPRKRFRADGADSWREHSLRHDQTIDILPIA